MTQKVVVSTQFPYLWVLTIVFVTLKLCDVIAWSWWLVLSPLWAPIAALLAAGLFGLLLQAVVELLPPRSGK